MPTVEQRVRSHAVAAGLLDDGEDINGYLAEGAAYAADACAHALAAGADLCEVVEDLSRSMTRAGASSAEHAYVQLVVAEVRLVIRQWPAEKKAKRAAAIRAAFKWTDRPRDGGPRPVITASGEALDDQDCAEAAEIYRVAMYRAFSSSTMAYRAWDAWHHEPASREGQGWGRSHREAARLAFAGLDATGSTVRVRFVFGDR